MWVSGAIEAKKNNPGLELSKDEIQTWVNHIGKDLINRENLVYFRGIEQNMNKNSV